MASRALRRRPSRIATVLWIPALLAAPLASPLSAELPPEDRCPTLSGLPAGGPARDAAPVRIHEGMLLSYNDVLLLGTLLPVEVWRNRNAFFHEGMRMEIGPCHRRYPLPGFYTGATERHAGKARLDTDGNLTGHVAGLPFPPETIDSLAGDAGVRWAWNLERRYRGAGPSGRFRIVDMPSRMGGIQTYEGHWDFVQVARRADLAGSDYALSVGKDTEWISGGRFDEPVNARHLAWRQLRPARTAERYSLPDDTFVYVPTMRKVRRSGSTWVDGVFVPRYRAAGDSGGGGLAVGGELGGGGINPAAAESIATTESLRRGFEGYAFRPNAYTWRVLAEREVLAPLNVTHTGYPEDRQRNFGPSGLSVGSDRFDVRWAVVIQGAAKERGRDFDLLTIWVDYQTQQPLYVMTRRRRGSRLIEVGVLLHRFSGDLSGYPRWLTGEKALVFDPVAAVFFDVADGGSGWRREAYDLTSVPRSETELRRLTSPGFLTRGR
jgi:hypothetical protein